MNLPLPTPNDWPMVITHISILFAAMGGLLTGIAATVNAAKGRKAAERGEATSKRNEAAILVVHGLVNGETAALRGELAAARERIAALEGN